MDIIQQRLESIQLPSVTYIVVTLILVYIGRWIDGRVLNQKRERLVQSQRQLYFQKLDLEASRMEEERLRDELQVAREIESVRAAEDRLRGQVASEDLEAYESDLENCRFASESSSEANGGDDEDGTSNHQVADEAQVHELAKELERVHCKAEQLQSMEEDVSRLVGDIVAKEECDVEPDVLSNDSELLEKVRQLEEENECLKTQLAATPQADSSPQLLMQTSSLDPQLVDYLERHNDILTLPFLEKAHERLLELKATEPELDFDTYIGQLKEAQDSYNKRLAELKVGKKKVEIELDMMKKQYQKELTSFNECRVEHLLKSAGGSIYVKSLEDRNKLDKETMEELRRKLEFCKSELASWEKKYNDADNQALIYFKAFEDTKKELERVKKSQLQERQFMYNPPLNASSASSLIGGNSLVPPPPPIDIPSYDELIRAASDSNQHPPLFTTDPNSSIPPPPPLDMPINDILRQ